MDNVFMIVISISLSGSIMTLLLLALKPLIGNKVTKAFSYYVWLLILLRLSLPFGYRINFSDYIHNPIEDELLTIYPNDSSEQYMPLEIQTPLLPNFNQAHVSADNEVNSFDLLALMKDNLTKIWIAGMLVSFFWHMSAYAVFRFRIYRTSTTPHADDVLIFEELRGGRNVRFVCCNCISTPMVMGVFKSVIIVPQLAYKENGMETDFRNILHHELTHYRRHDAIFKWFVVLVNSVHWFNPLVYLISREIRRASELACDEAAVRRMSPTQRRSYGNTLLTLAGKKQLPIGAMASTLCNEKLELKGRLIGIMNYSSKSNWAIVLMLALTVLLAGCASVYPAFALSGVETKNNDENHYERERLDEEVSINYNLDDGIEKGQISNSPEFSEIYESATLENEGFLSFVEKLRSYTDSNSMNANLNVDYNSCAVVVSFDESVFFVNGYSDIKAESYDLLDSMAELLAGHMDVLAEVIIESHTNGVPVSDSRFYDEWEFSMERVANILLYITNKTEGIDKGKMVICAWVDDPAEEGDTYEEGAFNRRVDFVIQFHAANQNGSSA